jgi:hypothetical protein
MNTYTLAQEIEQKKEIAAQVFFEDYDFGDGYPVTDFSNNWNKDGIYWSKMVYGDNPEGDRWAGSFGIEFKDKTSDEIVNDWLEIT